MTLWDPFYCLMLIKCEFSQVDQLLQLVFFKIITSTSKFSQQPVQYYNSQNFYLLDYFWGISALILIINLKNIKCKNSMNESKKQQQPEEPNKNLSVPTYMSIPFLAINFYDLVFFVIYMIITIGLLVYKVQKYPMPDYSIAMEGTILVFFALTHAIRARIGNSGIIQKEPRKIQFYLIVSVLMICNFVFQLRLQMYVLLADFILNWIGLAMVIFECIAAAWIYKVFQRKKSIS